LEVFKATATEESDCSSAKRGGDLGPFEYGKMRKEFSEAAFALPVGGVSGIVETSSGVHIILRWTD
jgi:NIMA-interacting peptidyl-prolyl cis-trans isomerase 1